MLEKSIWQFDHLNKFWNKNYFLQEKKFVGTFQRHQAPKSNVRP